jgi:hypothetical protein
MWDKNAFHASGNSSIDVKFEGTYLSPRGFQVDVVDGLGALFDNIDSSMETIGQPKLSQTHSPYPDEDSVWNTLWRTLVSDIQ